MSENRWSGYSSYDAVSESIAEAVVDAVMAYSTVDSMYAEHAPMTAELATRARSKLLSASMQLRDEMERDRDNVDFYDDALSRWEGEDGYLRRLSDLSLQDECPGWLFQFVLDIRKAAWELGYLRAGRNEPIETPNPDEAEVEAMFR